MPTRENVQAVIDGVVRGEIVDHVGKAVNRAFEEQCVANIIFHAASVGRPALGGGRSGGGRMGV